MSCISLIMMIPMCVDFLANEMIVGCERFSCQSSNLWKCGNRSIIINGVNDDSKDYGKFPIYMLNRTKRKESRWYPCVSDCQVFSCVMALGGGSVFDYVLIKESDEYMVNILKFGPLSPDLKHKPLCLHIATNDSHVDQCIRGQNETRYIMWYFYQKANIY